MSEQSRRDQAAVHPQKKPDIETGLDYFGARYYASMQGWFTSVDPSRKSITATNPQTWNRYNFTLNSPLRYVDENGKWPTDTHNRIIEKAFRTLDPKLVRHIQRGSEMVDGLGANPRTLYEKNVPQHAMTPGSMVRKLGSEQKAREWAKNEATNFINTNMGQAKDFYEKTNQTNSEASKLILTVGAFESFGKGAHTIMDGASPAHRDFQVYDTQGYKLLGLISPVAGGRSSPAPRSLNFRSNPEEAVRLELPCDGRSIFDYGAFHVRPSVPFGVHNIPKELGCRWTTPWVLLGSPEVKTARGLLIGSQLIGIQPVCPGLAFQNSELGSNDDTARRLLFGIRVLLVVSNMIFLSVFILR